MGLEFYEAFSESRHISSRVAQHAPDVREFRMFSFLMCFLVFKYRAFPHRKSFVDAGGVHYPLLSNSNDERPPANWFQFISNGEARDISAVRAGRDDAFISQVHVVFLPLDAMDRGQEG